MKTLFCFFLKNPDLPLQIKELKLVELQYYSVCLQTLRPGILKSFVCYLLSFFAFTYINVVKLKLKTFGIDCNHNRMKTLCRTYKNFKISERYFRKEPGYRVFRKKYGFFPQFTATPPSPTSL